MRYLLNLFCLTSACFLLHSSCQSDDKGTDPLMKILAQSSDIVKNVIEHADKYEIQIRYTQIDRDHHNYPHLTTHNFRVDTTEYFYPASTVKMPVAFLAMERINELAASNSAINLDTRMDFGAEAPPQSPMTIDSSSPTGYPQVRHFVEQIFSVSNNEAYNRLYEFVGQDYINQMLREKSIFTNSRIRTRVGISGFDTESNKYTNPLSMISDEGDTLYTQDEYYAIYEDFASLSNSQKGRAYYDDHLDSIINTPFDMSEKNFISIPELEAILMRVILPEIYPEHNRFNLTDEQYSFLYTMMPKAPNDFSYHKAEGDHDNNYVKFFVDSASAHLIPDQIKIFNKVGWAYGTLTDCSYIIDVQNGTEFFLTATILVNDNETFNDGVYEYESIGVPFFAALGRSVLAYEKTRKRQYKPDFSRYITEE